MSWRIAANNNLSVVRIVAITSYIIPRQNEYFISIFFNRFFFDKLKKYFSIKKSQKENRYFYGRRASGKENYSKTYRRIINDDSFSFVLSKNFHRKSFHDKEHTSEKINFELSKAHKKREFFHSFGIHSKNIHKLCWKSNKSYQQQHKKRKSISINIMK